MPDKIDRSFENGIMKLRDKMLSCALHHTGHHQEDAEDIVQDAIVKALEKRHLFDGRHLNAWLCRIVTNIFYDRVRRKSFEERKLRGYTMEQPIEFVPAAMKSLQANDVRRAISRMNRRDAHVLTMYMEGYTMKEIAADNMLREDYARVLIFHIKKKIRCKLDGLD